MGFCARMEQPVLGQIVLELELLVTRGTLKLSLGVVREAVPA
jgi:hypothetical protein